MVIYAKQQSLDHLLGKSLVADQIVQFSNELQVSPGTPPTWPTRAEDDKAI